MPNVKNRYTWLPLFRFNPPTEGFPSISVKFSVYVKKLNGWPRYQTAKKNCKNFNRLSRAHERYRRQTDGTAIAGVGKGDTCDE